MKINKYNQERYPDPTCYQALVSIVRKDRAEKERSKYTPGFKPLVYICSPFAGDVEKNIINAKRYCRFAYKKNAIPLAPHLLYPQFLDDDNQNERKDGLFMGLVLLNKCHELWVFGSYISKGMRAEIDKAKRCKMVIRYFTDNMEETVNESHDLYSELPRQKE